MNTSITIALVAYMESRLQYQKIIHEIIDKYEEETDELIDKCFESALDEACNIEDHEQSVQNESMTKKGGTTNAKAKEDKLLLFTSHEKDSDSERSQKFELPVLPQIMDSNNLTSNDAIFSRRILSPFLPASEEDLVDLAEIVTQIYTHTMQNYADDADTTIATSTKESIVERTEKSIDHLDLSSLHSLFNNNIDHDENNDKNYAKDQEMVLTHVKQQQQQQNEKKKMKLLDLGCGDGRVMICLQKCFPNRMQSIGIDISDHCISLAESILDRESDIRSEEMKFFKLDLLNFLGTDYSENDISSESFQNLLKENIEQYSLEDTSIIFMYIYPTLMRAIEHHLVHFLHRLSTSPSCRKICIITLKYHMNECMNEYFHFWDSPQSKFRVYVCK